MMSYVNSSADLNQMNDLQLALHLADIADEISTARFLSVDLHVETNQISLR